MKLSKRMIAGAVSALSLVSSVVSSLPVNATSAPISEVVNDSGLAIDYARALQYSMYFYDANMCGTGVDENTRLSWRGDCHTYDAKVPLQPMNEKSVGTNLSQAFLDKYKDILDPDGDGGIDVSGGFHDAGDHVEFGMPENYTAATLGWGYYEFRDSYVKLGQDDHIETILRYFNDYLMKCTFRDADGTVIAHCYQVGDGNIDHAVWEAPEVDTMSRPAFFLTAEKPQTDYVVSACASLAINYLNFKESDPEYAEKSLDYAKSLWKFANDNPKELSDNGDGPGAFYGSTKWEDDYCWAAAWMYLATGDVSSLELACEYFDYYAPSGWCYCWNDMWSGAAVLWAVINQEHPELNLVQMIRDAQGKNEYVFKDFWDDDCVGKCFRTWKAYATPGGYSFLSEWGSARYNTAMQFIGLVYDKYTNDGKPGEFSQWAQTQMDYILGDNDITYTETEDKENGIPASHGSRSFVVGYNDISAKYPHHRAASGLLMAEDTRDQKHILWGALVGGPTNTDSHNDITADWRENEVTIDYNAAFVGACAGIYEYFGTDEMAVTPDFPPADEKRGVGEDGESSKGYWVEACGIDDINSQGAGVTKVSFKVMSGESKPSDKLSVRYFFNTKEIAGGISAVSVVNELYDQSSAEVEGADGIISGPFKYDKLDDTYYIEVSWDGYYIANSGKKYQFLTGMYYGDKWDPTNDWSYSDLTIYKEDDAFFANGTEKKVSNMCVYDDGVLVGGVEPDGTVPATDEPEQPTDETTTSPYSSATDKAELYGDADCDGNIKINDAVLILQSIANPDKFTISSKGTLNADCYKPGSGISSMDALSIQKYLLGIVTLPEK